MGVASVSGLYDCNGRIAAWRTYVYVFMARDGDGPMYVKVGRSDNPLLRVGQVQVGCPFPIIRAGMVKCLTLDQARGIERALQDMLRKWSSSGEWFRFDWNDSDERQTLMASINVAFAGVPDWKFEEIDVVKAAAAMRRMVKERQQRSRARRKRTNIAG